MSLWEVIGVYGLDLVINVVSALVLLGSHSNINGVKEFT
jgi:hypothetical protein